MWVRINKTSGKHLLAADLLLPRYRSHKLRQNGFPFAFVVFRQGEEENLLLRKQRIIPG